MNAHHAMCENALYIRKRRPYDMKKANISRLAETFIDKIAATEDLRCALMKQTNKERVYKERVPG